ncbi:class IIb bacteriocin, lactobin A/cerein 7B family [Marinifilum sp. RC60d5]|uniref:class IIb bacteriocin, lactobin A/cerein 7B family n=1 Tax=Marinifilum sp. RC60d5 TaxID=3458414 RepID=UPI0040362643
MYKELSKKELRRVEGGGGRTVAGWIGYAFGYLAKGHAGNCSEIDGSLLWTTRGGM